MCRTILSYRQTSGLAFYALRASVAFLSPKRVGILGSVRQRFEKETAIEGKIKMLVLNLGAKLEQTYTPNFHANFGVRFTDGPNNRIRSPLGQSTK